MQVRRATIADLEGIAHQFDAYREFYKRKPASDEARAFIATNLNDDRSVIFIVINDAQKIVGFVQLYSRLSSLSMASYFYLSDLYVDKEYRRLGLGKFLMEAAEEYSIANGASSVQLETAHSNKSAQCLYESLGYEWCQDYRSYFLSLAASLSGSDAAPNAGMAGSNAAPNASIAGSSAARNVTIAASNAVCTASHSAETAMVST